MMNSINLKNLDGINLKRSFRLAGPFDLMIELIEDGKLLTLVIYSRSKRVLSARIVTLLSTNGQLFSTHNGFGLLRSLNKESKTFLTKVGVNKGCST